MHSLRFSGPARNVYELVRLGVVATSPSSALAAPQSATVVLFCAEALLAHPDIVRFSRACGLPRPGAGWARCVADRLSRGCSGGFQLRLLETRRVFSCRVDAEPVWLTALDPEPTVVATTWFQLTTVDELGEPLPDIQWRIRVGDQWQLPTDEAGQIRIEDAPTSFGTAQLADHAGLVEALQDRWSSPRGQPWAAVDADTSTVAGLGATSPVIALSSETPHTVIFQPRVTRARVVGAAFDTNKSFVRPEALPRLQDVVSLYGTHPDAQLLIAGHTDTSGEPEYNDALSLARAQSVSSYLADDVDAWLQLYETSVSSSQRWGDVEDRLMLDHVLLQTGTEPRGDAVAVFQTHFGLTVDGDLGPNTRRELIFQYMALDGTTLPPGITVVPHGCGESFPLAQDADELDVAAPDGQDDPTDRRVELFFFDPPLPVLPPPPGEISAPGAAEYLEWRLRSTQTNDFIVTKTRTLAVRVTNERNGEALDGARVQLDLAVLDGVGSNATGGVMTNGFGVAVFMALDIGTYNLRVDKDGFSESLRTHVLADNDPPTVIPVVLEPRAFVHVRTRVSDPEGNEITLPEGTKVVAEHEDGQRFDAQTDGEGVAAFKVDRDDGRLSLRLDLGSDCFLVVPKDGQDPRWVAETDALDATNTQARFVRVPPEQPLDSHLCTSSGSIAFEDDRFVALPDAATKTTPAKPFELTLAPRWQCIQFEFYDRFAAQPASVPALLGPDQPTPVLSGHLSVSTTTTVSTVVAHCVWPVLRGGNHAHCLAWFPDVTRALPDGNSMVRMTTPPSTYVVSAHDGEPRALEEVPASGPRFDLVDKPSATRLRFYDVPTDWRSHGYWVRLSGEPNTLKKRYVDRATEPTTPAKPMIASLDDIVLARSNDAGAAVVLNPSAKHHAYSILDQNLKVYKPNRVSPAGYGEPYFTNRADLIPSPDTDPDLDATLILDHPEFTRAVVHDQIHDVFDRRMTATDSGDAPIGARLALSIFTSDKTDTHALEEEAAQQKAEEDGNTTTSGSNHYFQSFYYREPYALQRNPDGLTWKNAPMGRCSMAVFRCCGHEDGGKIENFAVLRRLRLHANFSPTAPPPGAAVRLGAGKYVAPTPAEGRRIVAQALATAAHRWNGTEGEDTAKVIDPLDLKAPPKAPHDTSTTAPMFEVGEPVTARGRHVVLFTRGADRESTRTNIHVNVYEGVRASMPHGDNEAEWDLDDFQTIRERPGESPTGDVTARRFTFAHELGHALGLNDEYLEKSTDASLGAPGISDVGIPPGGPYASDADTDHKTTLGSMMNTNQVPRNRHFWSVVPWLVHRAGMFTGSKCTVVRGDHRYSLPVTPRDETPHMFPVAATPTPEGSQIRRKGLCDAFLYQLGHDAYVDRLSGTNARYDALIVARLKFALTFDHYSLSEARGISTQIVTEIQHAFNGTFSVFAEVELDGVPLRARVFVSPRVIVRNLPIAGSDGEEVELDEYLAKLSYTARDGTGELTVQSAATRVEKRAVLAAKAEKIAEAKAKPAELKADVLAKEAAVDKAEAELAAAEVELQRATEARDSGSVPEAEAEAAVRSAAFDKLIRDNGRRLAVEALEKARTALAEFNLEERLEEIEAEHEAAQEAFDEAAGQRADEHKALVNKMIEEQHVHANVLVQRHGITRITDRKSVPREVIARFRYSASKKTIKMIDMEAFVRVAGRMLGLVSPGFWPPAREYKPLCEALKPVPSKQNPVPPKLTINKVKVHK